MRLFPFSSFVFLSLALGACGSSVSSGTTSSADPKTSLAGTWDVTSSFTGNPSSTRAGTLTIGKDEFVASWPRRSLAFHRTGDTMTLTWTTEVDTRNLTVKRSAAALDLGALPLDLGGSWTFTDPTNGPGSCNATAGGTSFSGACNGLNVYWPQPDMNSSANGTRTEARTSIFGDLGGVWSLTTASGAKCDATFEGSVATLSCAGTSSVLHGSITITFGDGVASGTTSRGVEFAAHRR